MLPVILLIVAVICLLSLPGLVPVSTSKCRLGNVAFNDYNRDEWFTCMEMRFRDTPVAGENQVSYAINVGLASAPELKNVMTERFEKYKTISGQAWMAWKDFKDDISRVSDAAVLLRTQNSLQSAEILALTALTPDDSAAVAASILKQLYNEMPNHTYDQPELETEGITIPKLPEQIPLPKLPSPEEILRRIKELIDKARKELEQIRKDAKAQEIFDKIQHFVQVQIAALPEEVRKAVLQFDNFRKEHPYIVAGATVALTIIVGEVLLPWAVLGVLRMVGFSELGPVAGSWSALIQSALYGGRTRGLFSIIQSITMKARLFWPVRVFTGLTAIAAGAVVVWTAESVKDAVEAWSNSDATLALPDLNLLAMGDGASLYELENWIIALGNKCAGAGIPEEQWLDVAIQFLTHEVESMVEKSGL